MAAPWRQQGRASCGEYATYRGIWTDTEPPIWTPPAGSGAELVETGLFTLLRTWDCCKQPDSGQSWTSIYLNDEQLTPDVFVPQEGDYYFQNKCLYRQGL